MSYASSHLDASIITLFAAIQPPITAVLEFIWEGKELGFKKICGMICVGIGMMCFTHIKKLDSHHRQKR
jgi:drug/metabolite transporter (DMT)-like permease